MSWRLLISLTGKSLASKMVPGTFLGLNDVVSQFMSKQVDVIVAGHLCIDLLPQMANVPLSALTQAGRLHEVSALDVSTGGAVSNTGLALHRLGAKVKLMSAVGSDHMGQLIVSFLNQRDPSLTQYIKKVEGVSSSYSIVLSPQRVDRIFLHHPGTNAVFDADSIDYGAVDTARIAHLGYPPILPKLYLSGGKELVKIFKRLKQREVVTSLDMSLPDASGPAGSAPWKAILQAVLPYVDVFIPSFEEIVYMLRHDDFVRANGHVEPLMSPAYVSSIADELIGLGVVVAGVKCGVDGLLVRTANLAGLERIRRHIQVPSSWNDTMVLQQSFQTKVIGTTGAGDSAYAGFLTAMVRGWDIQEALRIACAVAACNVEAADATSGIRDWDATIERLASPWPVNPSRLVG